MKDLKCGKKSCKHNKGYCCCAKQVQVDKDADCLTFCPDDGMSEFAQDGGKANYSVDTAVSCNADCIFRKDGKCIANGITVTSDDSGASCMTFVKK
ncbi:unknown [Firmicutes bacterium CAG:552]|jgi:hypothetical protein|nr:MAG: hypothetical protein BHW39_09815 [Firmicutes bacterium CAG:552_39_19]CDB26786.1 unknown [Firmicutes bacterium CAG:552]